MRWSKAFVKALSSLLKTIFFNCQICHMPFSHTATLLLKSSFLNQHALQIIYISLIFYGVVIWKDLYSKGMGLKTNRTRKSRSPSCPKLLSLATRLVISIMCSFMIRVSSNFIVIISAISFPARDLLAEWKWSLRLFRNSFAFVVSGRDVLMLGATHIRINISANLFNHGHPALTAISFSLLVSIIAVGSSLLIDMSRSRFPDWTIFARNIRKS